MESVLTNKLRQARRQAHITKNSRPQVLNFRSTQFLISSRVANHHVTASRVLIGNSLHLVSYLAFELLFCTSLIPRTEITLIHHVLPEAREGLRRGPGTSFAIHVLEKTPIFFATAANYAATIQKIHKIRITLTSRKVNSLEKVCSELIERAKSKDLRVKGPVRLPTKKLKVSTRKTPNGEGSKTWDLYEMRIHKRLIDLNAPTEVVKQIIINVEAGVEVEVTIAA